MTPLTRRRFLKDSSRLMFGASGVITASTRSSAAPKLIASERVQLAAVGVGGKGWSDIREVSAGHDVVAFCDVDQKPNRRKGGFLAAAERWPQARRYRDWREMLDREHSKLDGITVSTPDHMHAPVTMIAMQSGLAVYTQKPLTRTVYEARQLTRFAASQDVVTQMGNQNHSGIGYRTVVELVRERIVGKVRAAHCWSNRPIWPQGVARPKKSHVPPASLAWDSWLGVAPDRPFVENAYHPFNWRGWFDFGAGALGDMGCHIIDPVVWSLELGPPNSVRYDGPDVNDETFPHEETITYQFPGTRWTTDKSIKVTWYDGGRLPPRGLTELPDDEPTPPNGCLLIGEYGVILTPHGGLPRVLPEERFRDRELPDLEPVNHYLQWTNAIRGEGQTSADFSYSGPLTETVLLGTIAPRFPDQELEWDALKLQFKNSQAANEYIRQPYRQGWEVDGL